jgi:CBS domain-containing membrane protein
MDATQVKDVMTTDVTTLKRNEQLSLADDLMNLGRIRHLPVLDDEGKDLIGIVSQRDLFRGGLARAVGYGQHGRRKLLNSLQVKDVMVTDLITTTPETSLLEAAKTMMERKVGCLPVLKNGALVGILTEGDFVALFVKRAK